MNHDVVMLKPRTCTTMILGSVDYCYVAYNLSHPDPHAPNTAQVSFEGEYESCVLSPLVAAHWSSRQDHPPNWAPPVFVSAYWNLCQYIGPYAHLRIYHLRRLPPLTDLTAALVSWPSSPSPRLNGSCFRLYPAASGIVLNVALRQASTVVCLHHGYLRLTPPSYPVYCAHTSKIGRMASLSATVACIISIYVCNGCITTTCNTL